MTAKQLPKLTLATDVTGEQVGGIVALSSFVHKAIAPRSIVVRVIDLSELGTSRN